VTPTSVMKSRRLTGCPSSRESYSTILRDALCITRKILTANVRFGSEADMARCRVDVRLTSNGGHPQA